MISIIIPVYNNEKFIVQCLDSIVNQTYKDLEIIIVDDGSTDNSSKICDDYAAIDNRINIIHQKNGGVSNARNNGLKIAKGDYIGFLDSDDYIDYDMYEFLLNNIIKYEAEISICEYYKNGNSLKKDILFSNTEGIKETLSEEGYITGHLWNKLFNKELFKDLYFDETLKTMEDHLMIINVFEKCKKIIYSNTPKYHYTVNSDSAMRKSSVLTYINILNGKNAVYEKIIKDHKDYIKEISLNRLNQILDLIFLMSVNKVYDKDFYKKLIKYKKIDSQYINLNSLNLLRRLVYFFSFYNMKFCFFNINFLSKMKHVLKIK